MCLCLYMYACSQTWCIYLMWLSLNYVPLLYFSRFYRASNEKLLNSLHSLSVFVCSSPRAKNFKHKTNQWTEWGEVAEKDTAKSNILRHKDGTKNEYVMFVSYKYQQCSDVYLWVASLVLYRSIFQANNVMKKKKKRKTNSQWNKKISKKNRTAYFTINEDKLCTSSRMQFSLLYLPICESRWWSLFYDV